MARLRAAWPISLALLPGCSRETSKSAKPIASVAASARAQAPASPATLRAVDDFGTYIPAQCYTQTRGVNGRVYNPCYTCHSFSKAPNFVDDSALQAAYTLPASARKNPYLSLFVDRGAAIARISEAEILAWVRRDNYADPSAASLSEDSIIPQSAGLLADAFFAFDDEGYDHAPDGSPSGWRAFAYYPFPGSFMPTNGSADDVLIRLPEGFRRDEQGALNRGIYSTNFAILEALIKQEDVPIARTDERAMLVDLDGDGKLGYANKVAFRFGAGSKTSLSWVGRARTALSAHETELWPGLYPHGTELLHSVRYLDIDARGRVKMAPRMKELRYAKKLIFLDQNALEQVALVEANERKLQPDALRSIAIDAKKGAYTHLGWRYHGLIEDASGALRLQTRQELASCVGCHSGLGATTDGTFAFARKLPAGGPARGWYHWAPTHPEPIAEPRRSNGQFEYTFYLATAGAGDELRSNTEVWERFFDAQGGLRPESVRALHADIGALLWPSRERALALNKAYRALVSEQHFERGRDAPLKPLQNVFKDVPAGELTGIREPIRSKWERRYSN